MVCSYDGSLDGRALDAWITREPEEPKPCRVCEAEECLGDKCATLLKFYEDEELNRKRIEGET